MDNNLNKMHERRQFIFYRLVILFIIIVLNGCGTVNKTENTIYLTRSRQLRAKEVKWKLVVDFAFENADDFKKYKTVNGKWKIRNGSLVAEEGRRNRTILLYKCKYDPVRIELDIVSHTAANNMIGDITILLNSTPDKNFFNNGYALTTGSYWNNCTTFYKKGVPFAHTEFSPLVADQKNHIVVEFNKGHIRYWLNDRIILSAWDDEPLVMNSSHWFGIRTWGTILEIDKIKIYREEKSLE